MSTRPRVRPRYKARTLGIDVSRFQGTIDWQRVAQATVRDPDTGKLRPAVQFAFIRSSGAEWIDAEFARNWSEARKVGLARGPYIALHAESASGLTHFETLKRALGDDYRLSDLPPAIDIEKPDDPNHEMVGRIVSTALELARAIERGLGRRPIIYTGSYWEQHIYSQRPELGAALSKYALWTPDYREDTATLGPGVPHGWSRWLIHQYSSRGSVPGIHGNVDLNRFDGGAIAFNFWRVRSHTIGSPAAIGALALLGVLAGLGIYALSGEGA